MFEFFTQKRERKRKAVALYNAARVQSRQPVFYEEYAVPDTVDGRFEMLALHCYILMRRLNVAGDKKQAQALFDVFFKNIDKNLREMGIGDLGVPKHMKRMMQGFNGRATEYEKAITGNDDDSLKQAVIRNIYGTLDNPDPEVVALMALYIQENVVIDSLGAVFASPLAGPKQAEGRKYG